MRLDWVDVLYDLVCHDFLRWDDATRSYVPNLVLRFRWPHWSGRLNAVTTPTANHFIWSPEMDERRAWMKLSEPSFAVDWDNEQDAAYDGWENLIPNFSEAEE